MMASKGFVCFDSYLTRTAKLSDQEVGRLFRACMAYHATGELPELAGRESIAFDFIREDIDSADAAYNAKCETNRQSRLKAINERQRTSTNVDERSSKATNVANENENEKENVKDSISLARQEVSERFTQFWKAYPRKVGKPAAEKAFHSIKPDEQVLSRMLTAIETSKRSRQWQEDNGRFIPHPATWLHQRRWEDEPIEPSRPAVVYAGNDAYGGDL